MIGKEIPMFEAERLRSLHEDATPGPWRDAGGDAIIAGIGHGFSAPGSFVSEADRDLMIFLRNYVPAILAMAEECKRMREVLERISRIYPGWTSERIALVRHIAATAIGERP